MVWSDAEGGGGIEPRGSVPLPPTQSLSAKEGCGLVLAGQPIDEPIVGHRQFVMNTGAEIHQAVHDFSSGRLAG